MALVISYLLFGLYFVAFKAGDLVIVKRAQNLERQLDQTETLHKSLLQSQQEKGLTEQELEKPSKMLQQLTLKRQILIERAARIEKN